MLTAVLMVRECLGLGGSSVVPQWPWFHRPHCRQAKQEQRKLHWLSSCTEKWRGCSCTRDASGYVCNKPGRVPHGVPATRSSVTTFPLNSGESAASQAKPLRLSRFPRLQWVWRRSSSTENVSFWKHDSWQKGGTAGLLGLAWNGIYYDNQHVVTLQQF